MIRRYDNRRHRLREWFSQPLGQLVLEQERHALEKILSTLFGYYIVQLGILDEADTLLSQSRISHHVALDIDGVGNPVASPIIAVPEELPLASDSIDVIVMPHTLEFADDPHTVLREAERVLIPEGHMIILAFNPWSLCGLRRLLSFSRQQEPWNGQFLTLHRLKDWLALMGFEIRRGNGLCFRPPINHPILLQRCERMEELGRRFWPLLAGINVIVAKKRVSTLTPVGLRRRIRRRVLAGVAEPTARNGYRFDE